MTCMIGFPNRADSATLSGGSWNSSLPLTNLQSRIIGKVARSTNANTSSTKFDVDLGSAKNTRLVSLVNHNISLTGQYRVRGATDSGFTAVLIDTGWIDVWPTVYPSEALDWEDDNWWTGQYTAEQISGYNKTLVVILSAATIARYWRVEISDTTNSEGYVQIGRLFIGPAWQPTRNMSYGASNGWETKTDIQEALGGAEYFQRRTPYRIARFSLDWMSEDQGLANAFEIDRRAGVDQEVLWIFDTADTVHALRRQFLGRLRQLSPIEYPYPLITKKAYEIKELL